MGAKQQPKIGADGRSYFTYGIGASWLVDTGTGNVLYQILGARYTDGEQSYLIAVTSAAGETLREMPLQRLAYLLKSSKQVQEIEQGEDTELPLTMEEVIQYYTSNTKERNKQKRETTAKLKDEKEYQALLAEEKKLATDWTRSLAGNDDRATAIEKRINEIAAKKKAILNGLKVNISLLDPVICTECEGKGVTKDGHICNCALAKSDEIKAYCAAVRLVDRKLKGQFCEKEEEYGSEREKGEDS